jgi:hypothetical protein
MVARASSNTRREASVHHLTRGSVESAPWAEAIQALSKTKRVESICKVYEQLIELEIRRYQNPLRVKSEERRVNACLFDGSIKPVLTKKHTLISDFSLQDYQQKLEDLTRQLQRLDAYHFMMSLSDDLKSLNKIRKLCQKWDKLRRLNTENFNQIAANVKQLQLTDHRPFRYLHKA